MNSLRFNGHFYRWTLVSWYQNIFILDIFGAKDDESDGVNWSYNTCKAGITLSPPTNQQTNTQLFYRPDALPVAQPTVSKKNHKKLS